MKSNIYLMVFFMFSSFLSAQTLQWSDPVAVSNGVCPAVDINKEDKTIHVAASAKGTGIVYTIMDSLGSRISQETVPHSQNDFGGWFYGPGLALDKEGNPHVLIRSQTQNPRHFNLHYTRKRDGRWSYPFLVSSEVLRGAIVRLVVDDEGRVHIAQGYAVDTPNGAVNYYQINNGAVNSSKTHEGLGPFRVDNNVALGVTSEGTVHLVLGSPDINSAVQYYTIENEGDDLVNRGNLRNIQVTNRAGAPDIFVDAENTVHIVYGTRIDLDVEGKLSIRYVRFDNGTKTRDIAATRPGAMQPWKGTVKAGWGLSSVAASSDGKMIGIAYLVVPEGPLHWITSMDNGAAWSSPIKITDIAGWSDWSDEHNEAFEGRNIHAMSAYDDHFYCVYPVDGKIRMRILRNATAMPPIADAGGPYHGYEGLPLMLDMSASIGQDGETSSISEYAWDWNMDGNYDFITESSIVEVTFNDNFDHDAVLRVTNRFGLMDYDTTRIRIENNIPVVDAGADRICYEGDTLIFKVDIHDPGDEGHYILWNFGDGNTAEGDSVIHAYGDKGTGLYNVIVSVTDDDGAAGRDTVKVTVRNALPAADGGGPYWGETGEVIQFSGSGWDPGFLNVLTYSWDLNFDGTFETEGSTAQKSYDAIGVYYARFRAMDNHGGYDIDTVKVEIVQKFSVHFNTDPPGRKLIINGDILDTPVTLHFYSGSEQAVEAPLVQDSTDTERLFFSNWSNGASREQTYIIPGYESTLTASYNKQYYLMIDSDYGSPEGQGWHNEGSSANFTVTSPCSITAKSRAVFVRWEGAGHNSYTGQNPSASVMMANPITQKAFWDIEYLIKAESVPPNGGHIMIQPEGSWFQQGTPITMTAVENAQEAYMFMQWTGDLHSTDNPVSFSVDSGMHVKAHFLVNDTLDPEIVYFYPPNNSSGIPVNAPLHFRLIDPVPGLGLNLSSLMMILESDTLIYEGTGADGVSIQFDADEMTLTIDCLLYAAMPANSMISCRIYCEDNQEQPNHIDTTLTFHTGAYEILSPRQTMIDKNGGSMSTEDNSFRFQVIQDRLDENILFTIGGLTGMPDIEETANLLGQAYYLGPDGFDFSNWVHIRLDYTQSDLNQAGVSSAEDLKVFHYSTALSEWTMLEIDRVTTDNIYAKTYQTGIFVKGYGELTNVAEKPELPEKSNMVMPVYPNPFNSSTKLPFYLKTPANVRFIIYNEKGQRVWHREMGVMGAGEHLLGWDGHNSQRRNMPSGVYIFVVQFDNNKIISQKGLLIR